MVVHLMLPGAMPSPVPAPQDSDASPRLRVSLIVPLAPVSLVPGPSAGRGSTTISCVRAPLLKATKETLPAETLVGLRSRSTSTPAATLGVPPDPIDKPDPTQLRRKAVLGGLIHEYRLAARPGRMSIRHAQAFSAPTGERKGCGPQMTRRGSSWSWTHPKRSSAPFISESTGSVDEPRRAHIRSNRPT